MSKDYSLFVANLPLCCYNNVIIKVVVILENIMSFKVTGFCSPSANCVQDAEDLILLTI